MYVIAVNGSPRKDWNTGTLLASALEGAESAGARTRLVHLYDLEYQGCTSCFCCKRKGNTCDGLCNMRDELRDVLADALACDALILGSPIYFGDVTGEMRSFLERLLFPSTSYDEFGVSTFGRKLSCAWVFTMNCPERFLKEVRYDVLLDQHARLTKILGSATTEVLTSHETYQFADYSVMNAAVFDVEAKVKWREEQLPLDRREAFELGVRLADV